MACPSSDHAVHQETGLAHVVKIIDSEQLHSGSGLCKRQRCGDVHDRTLQEAKTSSKSLAPEAGLGSRAFFAQHGVLASQKSAEDQAASAEDQTVARNERENFSQEVSRASGSGSSGSAQNWSQADFRASGFRRTGSAQKWWYGDWSWSDQDRPKTAPARPPGTWRPSA